MKEKKRLLKNLRVHLAFKKGVEPYKIFRDTELTLLLKEEPKTLEELGRLKGFPPKGIRVTHWGEAIIAIFNKPERIEDFEIDLDSDGNPIARVVLRKMEIF